MLCFEMGLEEPPAQVMRHSRRSGNLGPEGSSGGPLLRPGGRLWTPAFEGVIQLRNLARSFPFSSFLRKREHRDFSYWPMGPRFRGDDELSCP
jgi:hypothetical protein